MAKIQLLDQHTINKIAAGEVVERPSAVVKELVENAIDAGANAVTVEIKGGGIEFIRITDNGCGIEADQVRIAFERHATSKIRSAEDLLSVSSLGFRGEALASISAVAQVELVTKTRGALTGTRYAVDGGEEKFLEEIGCPEGTTFVIRNLFYNVPARRKFLKSAQTEASYINDLVERLAISNPTVAFKFMNNNQLKLQTSGNGNIKEIIYHIYGRDITSNLVEVSSTTPSVQIQGFVAKPVVNRGNRNYMNYFINGRYIKSAIVNKAIEEAYKPYMMQHRYPMTALQFSIDSQFIDVNVHPAKLEIRFTNGNAVYQAVYDAVSDALAGKNMIPEVSVGKDPKVTKPEVRQKKSAEPFEQKRKYEESGIIGKQMVEAAKLISKFEELEKKQKAVRETSAYQVQQKEPVETQQSAKKVAADALERFLQKNEPTHEVVTSQPKEEPVVGKTEQPDEKSVVGKIEQPDEKLAVGKTEQSVEKLVASETEQSTEKQVVNSAETSTEKQNMQKVLAETKAEKQSTGIETLTEQKTESNTTVEENKKDTQSTAEQKGNNKDIQSEEPIWDKTNSKQARLFETEEEQKFLSAEAKKQHKIIGQIFDTYWIVQYQDKMFIIDQHAAHEKVLFERTMKSLANKEIISQMLQPPIILSLSMREEQALRQHKEELEKLGFEVEAFGGREFSIRAVPANLFGVAQVELLTELLDDLVEEKKVSDSELILEKVATMSCKAAVKGNMKLSVMEAEALIDELMELDNPYHCPHGRPVIVSMSKYEIEKKFKRIV